MGKMNWTEHENKIIIEYVLKRGNTSRNGRIKDAGRLATLLPGREIRNINDRVFALRKKRLLPKPGKDYSDKVKIYRNGKHTRVYHKTGKYAKKNISQIEQHGRDVYKLVSHGTFEAIVIGSSIIGASILISITLLIKMFAK